MWKICILTATRAEYGLLKRIIEKFKEYGEIDTRVVVTGMHLSAEFGMTYREIETDGIVIDKKIPILLSNDQPSSISKSMGLAMINFADYFEQEDFDLLLVLGDRYETLAVCIAAMNQRIPIAHLYGGETTEGAVDECIRHAITKMSYLHFTSTEEYRRRVIQLGEAPERVYCVGAMGVENILSVPLMSKEELQQSINFPLDQPYAVVTFHPVTLEDASAGEQMKELLMALSMRKGLRIIFTKANADADGRVINEMIDEYCCKNTTASAFASLGMRRYLSALKYCDMVIGNSSSGLVEAPSFGVPTINIGDRQRGRMCADSVINCEPVSTEIMGAMEYAHTPEFEVILKQTINPYGNGETSERVVRTIYEALSKGEIKLKKTFYNINY